MNSRLIAASSVVIAGDHQPRRSCLGPCHQSSTRQRRQDSLLHRSRQRQSGQSDRIAQRSGRRHARRQSGHAVHPGRKSRLRCARRLGFADALKNTNIPLRVHLGLYQNETAELCQWHMNEAHYLEAWGDARAYDGTVSIVQPLIAPLTAARARTNSPRCLPGKLKPAATKSCRAIGRSSIPARTSIAFWRKSLHDGWIEGTTFRPKAGQL